MEEREWRRRWAWSSRKGDERCALLLCEVTKGTGFFLDWGLVLPGLRGCSGPIFYTTSLGHAWRKMFTFFIVYFEIRVIFTLGLEII